MRTHTHTQQLPSEWLSPTIQLINYVWGRLGFPFLVPAADLLATPPPPSPSCCTPSHHILPPYLRLPSLWACQPPVWVLPAEVESPVYSCPQGLRDHNKTGPQFRGVFIRAHNNNNPKNFADHMLWSLCYISQSTLVLCCSASIIKRLYKWMSLGVPW